MPAGLTTLKMIGIVPTQPGSLSFHTPVLNGTNIATYTDDTPGGTLGDVIVAAEALSWMDVDKKTVTAVIIEDGGANPTDEEARRERALVFSYVDNTEPSIKGTISLPAPDLSIVGGDPSDEVDLTITEVAAMVTALEAAARSKIGNSITITRAYLVGRNN